MTSSSSSTEFGSASSQGDSSSYDSIEIMDTEYGKVIAKAPRVLRHRFGLPRMKYLATQIEKRSNSQKSKRKLKAASLIELLTKYEVFAQNLGLEESAVKTYISPEEKVKDLLSLLTLLGKINEVANLCGSDFTLNVLAELRKVHVWLSSKNKFNDKERAYVKTIRLEAQTNYHAKIYNFLLKAIERHYTPYLLLFFIYGIRAVNFLKETPLMDQKQLAEFVGKINSPISKKNKKANKAFEKKLANLVQFINEAEACYQQFKAQQDFSRKSPQISGFFNLAKEAITKSPAQQENARTLYYYSEEVIKFAIFILNDPMIDLEKKVQGRSLDEWLNKIIVYFFEIRDEAFTASSFLQEKLQQDIQNFKLVEDLVYAAKLDDVSYVYVNGSVRLKVDANNKILECNTIQHNLKQTKHRNLAFKTHRDGNESVVLVQDKATQEGVVIRGKAIQRDDELLGRSIDDLRWRLTNTLGLSSTTYLYHLVAGAVDPLTEHQAHIVGHEDQVIERHYEFSEIVLYDKTILLGRDLFDEFNELHQQCKQKHNSIALLALQVQFIEVTLQLVRLILHAAKYDVYLTDIKPRNFLITLENRRVVTKTSDNKGYQTPDDPTRDTLCSRYVHMTPCFHSSRIFIYQNDIKCVDLDLLSRETLIFTLTQLLTLTSCDFELFHQGYKAQFSHLKEVLSPGANQTLFNGHFGKEVSLIASWMLAMFQDKAELKDILIYFEQPSIKQGLAEAKEKLAMLSNPMAPTNMSPDQTRDRRMR